MIPKKIEDKIRKLPPPPFSPFMFRATLIAVVAAAFVVPLALLAVPYLDIFNDMAVQPKAKTQGLFGMTGDLKGDPNGNRAGAQNLLVERAPVAGTLPMGYVPYPYEDKDEETAKLAEEALSNPLPPTMEALEKGRKLFDYYCKTCHGAMGEGDGKIIGPGLFPAPPSMHTDSARQFKDGRVFHIITRGQNTMPSYADKFDEEEKWAIIHYVHALQRAMNPKPEDLEQ